MSYISQPRPVFIFGLLVLTSAAQAGSATEDFKSLIEDKGFCFISYADGQKRDQHNLRTMQSYFRYRVELTHDGRIATIRAEQYHELVGTTERWRDKQRFDLEWSEIDFSLFKNATIITENAPHAVQSDPESIAEDLEQVIKGVPVKPSPPPPTRMSSWVNVRVMLNMRKPVKMRVPAPDGKGFEETTQEFIPLCFSSREDAAKAQMLAPKVAVDGNRGVQSYAQTESTGHDAAESFDASDAALAQCRRWFTKSTLPHVSRLTTEANRILVEQFGTSEPKGVTIKTLERYGKFRGSQLNQLIAVVKAARTFRVSRGLKVLEKLADENAEGLSQQDLLEAISYLQYGIAVHGRDNVAVALSVNMHMGNRADRFDGYTGFCGMVVYLVFKP